MVKGKQFLVEVQRELPVEGCAGSCVEAVGDAIGALAGAALSGAVGVAEVALHGDLFTEFGMSGHLATMVIGQDGVELGGNASQGRSGRGIGHFHQDHQATGALDEHADRGRVERVLDEVTLPVAGQYPVVVVKLAQVDAQRVAQARAVLPGQARSALAEGPAHTRQRFAAPLAAKMRLQRVVGRLIREPGAGFVGVHAREFGRDLLGRPLPRQHRQHLQFEQRRRDQSGAGMSLRSAPQGHRSDGTADVAAPGAGVALDLAVEGRARSCQYSVDLANTSALLLQARDRQPVFRQMAVASRVRLHGGIPYLTGLSGEVLHFSFETVKSTLSNLIPDRAQHTPESMGGH